jgi:hypothetical protein
MLQKLKITSYALIVLLVLVLPSQADAIEKYAGSCAGFDCTLEGQICPQGAEGASDRNYVCTNSKWKKMNCEPDVSRELASVLRCYEGCRPPY